MKYLHGVSGLLIAALIWIAIMSLAVYNFPDGTARIWALLLATSLGVIILWVGETYGGPTDGPSTPPTPPTTPSSLV